MFTVYEAEHLIDAHLVRGRLEAEGIEAWVLGEWLTGALGELPATGLLRIGVGEADRERAEAVVAEWRHSEPVPVDEVDGLIDGALQA